MITRSKAAQIHVPREMFFSDLGALVRFARFTAQRGVWNGRDNQRSRELIRACSHRYQVRPGLLCGVLFTRDAGCHGPNEWTNPDYELSFHLTLGFQDEITQAPVPYLKKEGETIARAFFGEDVALTWLEPPCSAAGKANAVWHYRLFCDAGWNPIKPRGEVYSRVWMPEGWKPFSDLHGDHD